MKGANEHRIIENTGSHDPTTRGLITRALNSRYPSFVAEQPRTLLFLSAEKSAYGNTLPLTGGRFPSPWHVRPPYLSNRIYRSCRVAECSRRSILPRPINEGSLRETERNAGNSGETRSLRVRELQKSRRYSAEPPIRNNALSLSRYDTIKHSEADDFTRRDKSNSPFERRYYRHRESPMDKHKFTESTMQSDGTLPQDRFRPFCRGKWEGLGTE